MRDTGRVTSVKWPQMVFSWGFNSLNFRILPHSEQTIVYYNTVKTDTLFQFYLLFETDSKSSALISLDS